MRECCYAGVLLFVKETWECFDAGEGKYWWSAKKNGEYIDQLHFLESDPNWFYDTAGLYWTDDRDKLFQIDVSSNWELD